MPVYKRNYAKQNPKYNAFYELEIIEEKEAALNAFLGQRGNTASPKGQLLVIGVPFTFAVNGGNFVPDTQIMWLENLLAVRYQGKNIFDFKFDTDLNYVKIELVCVNENERRKKFKVIDIRYELEYGGNIIVRFTADEPVTLDLD